MDSGTLAAGLPALGIGGVEGSEQLRTHGTEPALLAAALRLIAREHNGRGLRRALLGLLDSHPGSVRWMMIFLAG